MGLNFGRRGGVGMMSTAATKSVAGRWGGRLAECSSLELDGSDIISGQNEVDAADVETFLALIQDLQTCCLSRTQHIRA
jgi:hypothetical protein